jgi:LCP family protein required for cell wall assembly
MVMHFDADRLGATVVGLPLEAEVKVPGHGTRALGSVPELGDPPLLVATVESLTGFRMDHLAVLDWQAFMTIVDRLGGIDVMVGGGGGPLSGAYRMQVDGTEALKVVSPRKGVDSVAQLRLQLTLMDAVVDGSLHQHKSPLLVYNFLDAVTENLAVDEEWSVVSMARLFLSVWALRSSDIEYVTVPASCEAGRDLCRPRLDESAATDFWNAVERDRINAWLSENDGRGRVNAHR